MHENARARVTFLLNLMFSRLDKSDDPIFGEGVRGLYSECSLGFIFGGRIFGEGGLYTAAF